jgi:RNA polymerase sigma-70 factor (ECF subfamily)
MIFLRSTREPSHVAK